ncbi:unnamed protein product [Rotaria socialis]
MASNINHNGDVDLILKATGDQCKNIDALYKTLKQEVEHLQPGGQHIGQGQHVINSSIVQVQCKIIDKFIESDMPDVREEIQTLNENHLIVQARKGTNLFSKNGMDFIVNTTAHIPDATYVDRNAPIYRVFFSLLCGLAVNHMKHLITTKNIGSPYKTMLQHVCTMMSQNEIYVDMDAREYWLDHEKGNKQAYQNAFGEVQRMLDRLEQNISQWVGQLRELRERRNNRISDNC